MFLKWIAKIFIAINANTKPGQISGGIACGLLLSFIPVSPLWALLLLVVFFIKVNLTVVIVFMGILGALAPLIAGFLNRIGYTIGYLPGVYDFLGFLNDIPVVSLLGLDNTLILGGLVCGIILFVPVYLVCNLLINLYRKFVKERLAKNKLIKKLLLIPVISKLADTVRAAYEMYAKA